MTRDKYVQKNNPFPITSCGRRRAFMNDNVSQALNSPGKDRTEKSPFNKRVDKDSMPCNKPRRSTKANKKMISKKQVKAHQLSFHQQQSQSTRLVTLPENIIFCTNCGYSNNRQYNNCKKCGIKLMKNGESIQK